MFAEGEFDVAMQPLDTFAEGSGDVSLGRFSIEKTYHGALAATSRGEMSPSSRYRGRWTGRKEVLYSSTSA
jgi:hypothetical protein